MKTAVSKVGLQIPSRIRHKHQFPAQGHIHANSSPTTTTVTWGVDICHILQPSFPHTCSSGSHEYYPSKFWRPQDWSVVRQDTRKWYVNMPDAWLWENVHWDDMSRPNGESPHPKPRKSHCLRRKQKLHKGPASNQICVTVFTMKQGHNDTLNRTKIDPQTQDCQNKIVSEKWSSHLNKDMNTRKHI